LSLPKLTPRSSAKPGKRHARSDCPTADATSGETCREADIADGVNPPIRSAGGRRKCDEPSDAKKKPPERTPAAYFFEQLEEA
jgi:hypothetical protein